MSKEFPNTTGKFFVPGASDNQWRLYKRLLNYGLKSSAITEPHKFKMPVKRAECQSGINGLITILKRRGVYEDFLREEENEDE